LNVILLYSDAVSQTNVFGNIATFISPIVENCLYGATSNIIFKFGGLHIYYPLKDRHQALVLAMLGMELLFSLQIDYRIIAYRGFAD